jgi:2-alkyl-3-oxoalkanoate reductase
VVADALDQPAMTAAMRQARPQAVVHQLTAIPVRTGVGTFDRIFAATNRLRTEGTGILLAAARSAGAHRFVAQSFCGWTYVRTGGPVKTEDDPLDPTPCPP